MRSLATMVLLATGGLAAAGCGSSSNGNSADKSAAAPAAAPVKKASAASSGPVSVKLAEWKVSPSATTVKAGKVTFDVANDGKTTHEMVILRTDKPAKALGSGNRVSEAGHVGEVGDVKAGGSGRTTVDLKPGHYVLICNLPGHYMSGMHTDLTVR